DGLYALPKEQLARLLKQAKARSVDAFEGLPIAERRAAIERWISETDQADSERSSAANTEDAGTELTYNRRNRLNRGLKWEDIADKNAALRVKEVVKSKVRPKPDYQAMVDGGMPPMVAHLVKQVYDSIAPSPQVRGNEASDADLRLYIDAVNRIMDGVEAWANDQSAIRKWAARQAVVAGAMLGKQVELSSLDAAPTLLDSVYPGGWKNFRAERMIAGGNRVLGALQPGYDEARRAMRDIDKGWPGKLEAWQRQGYKIVHTADVAEIRPTNVDGRFYISIAKQSHEFFPDRGSAEKALAEMQPVLLLDKRGRVVSQHGGDEQAAEAARAAAKRSTGENTIQEQGRAVESAERVGPARRMEGEDVSSDKLKDTFGFKGVNFGNWMKGDAPAKVAERQLHLNHAYDAFLDLADILGVPPKAMSLNGMLGIAIGAQGGGKALAHFVPGVNEINLTRTAGAGALAHEWGHALDHYFATLAGLDRQNRPYLTEAVGQPRYQSAMVDGRMKLQQVPLSADLRPEILEQFKAIVSAMSKRSQTPEEANAARQKQLEKYQRQTNNWLSAIRKDLENSIPGSREDADKQSAMAKFDQLAGRILALDLGDGKVSVGRQTFLSPVVSDLRDAFKSASGNVPRIDSMNALQANLDALQHVQDQIKSGASHQTAQVTTDYESASREADKGKAKPYWSSKTEMFARAFDAFVVDTLAEKAAANTYLAGIEAVPPMGEERKAIGGAFKILIGELKTKEADDGNVVLYSFAGQQADTANHHELSHAQQLLAAGADADEVRQQTGWFKGADGKWRFEISDDQAKLKKPFPSKAQRWGDVEESVFPSLLDRGKVGVKVGDLLDHPALFAAYPKIADIPVTTKEGSGASYSRANSIDPATIRIGEDEPMYAVRSLLLHEIQHGIQSIEGFATGGSRALMAGWENPQVRTLENQIGALLASNRPGKEIAPQVRALNDKIAALRRENPWDAYRRIAGEVEARNTQSRADMTDAQRRETPPGATADTADQDVILIFNGKEMQNAPTPDNARKASALAAVHASPADRAVFDMAAEGKSAADILGFISEASRNPFNRYLAKALRAIGVSPSIKLDSMSQWNFGEAKPGASYAAAYNPKTDTVALFTPSDAERHVLHELIHAATLKAIAHGGPAATQMRALFRHVQRSGELDSQYGMSNIDEFVAEAFSNPKFQQALRDVPAPAGSTLQNAWQWFVRAVARILGLKAAAQETALDRAMTVGAKLMLENA
ncbi:MAG: hypothetical protein NFW04_09950, partial [Candidatus Accumulibacter sp.]|uniref:LPD23 domain-containing protein n=1 Tax=Accumulibacter sp. TaxID=2053492 RepID=UPI0034579ECF|nr:hypothetical protein [Accumulibacter sp.]